MTTKTREIVLRHWRDANAHDWASFATLLAHDLCYEVPQTRERIQGDAAYVDFFRTWPQPWQVEVIQIIADIDHAVTVINFITDTDRITGISFFEIAAGKICRITDYWPSPYEPPTRVSQHVRRY